jgi:hypothetical protein
MKLASSKINNQRPILASGGIYVVWTYLFDVIHSSFCRLAKNNQLVSVWLAGG